MSSPKAAPRGMLVGHQNDLGPPRLALGSLASTDELAQVSYFFVKELDRILGLRAWHSFYLPPKYTDHRTISEEIYEILY